MTARSIAVMVGLLMAMAGCKGSAQVAEQQPTTEDEQTFYALGIAMGQSLAGWDLTPGELASVQKGVADAANGVEHGIDLEAYQGRIRSLADARVARAALARKDKEKEYLERAAAVPGAERSPTGLVYRALREGTGQSPVSTSTVKVQYVGKLTDGTVFDSSEKRGKPAEFQLGQVIPCWREGVQKMKTGGRAELVCHSDLAYGDRGRPGIPGGATLVFEIDLLDVH
jgi:FKBP-type peptidyl-prolyl cis-trans isomerase FkpA